MIRDFEVTLYSQNLQKARRFYQGLGFAETFRYPKTGEPHHIELTQNNFTSLTFKKRLQTMDLPPILADIPPSTMVGRRRRTARNRTNQALLRICLPTQE